MLKEKKSIAKLGSLYVTVWQMYLSLCEYKQWDLYTKCLPGTE